MGSEMCIRDRAIAYHNEPYDSGVKVLSEGSKACFQVRVDNVKAVLNA